MTSLQSIIDSIIAVDAFVEPQRLAWLWLVAVCAGVMLVGEVVRTRLRRRLFAALEGPRFTAAGRAPIAATGGLRRWWIFASRVAALACIVLALADPRGGAELIPVKPVNLQTVVLLDRSRSMAARDASPSRFEATQELVRGVVEEAAGGAVALVSFAAEAQVEMPLTRDYQGLLDRLDRLAPGDGPAAGTDLQAGLETAATCFAERMESPKILVVISDGETHGIEPELSATPLPRGTEVLMIGVGDADEGARIPLRSSTSGSGSADSFLTHEGELVRSRANPRLLREIAEELGGEFVSAEAAEAAVSGLLERTLRDSRESSERAYRRQAAPQFHWLLLAAVGLLGVEVMLADSRSAVSTGSSSSSGVQRPAAWLLLAAATTFLGGQSLSGQQPHDPPRNDHAPSNRSLRPADASPTAPSPTPIRRLSVRKSSQLYNMGVEAYRSGRWREAEALFDRVRRRGDGPLQSKARFNLANTQYAIVNHGGISQQEAIARLQTAIELYRQNLAEGQRSEDARANIEITYRRLRQIEQQSPDSQGGDGDEDQREKPPAAGADGAGDQPGSGQEGSGGGDSGQNGSGQGAPGRGDSGGTGAGTDQDAAAPPEASPEPELEEPLDDAAAEEQLRRIRQRARDNEQARRSEREEGDEQQPPAESAASPGGLPW